MARPNNITDDDRGLWPREIYRVHGLEVVKYQLLRITSQDLATYQYLGRQISISEETANRYTTPKAAEKELLRTLYGAQDEISQKIKKLLGIL